MLRTVRLAVAASALAACAACAAFAQPAPVPILSLAEALSLAERNHPRLAAGRARVAGAEAGITTAGQYPNPELEVTSGGVRARAAGVPSGRGSSLSVSQPIELPQVRESRLRGASNARTAERANLDEAWIDLAAEVRQGYLEVLQRKAETTLAIDTESLLAQIRNRIEVRVRVGEAPKFELTRADAELERARLQSAAARLRVTQALAQLRATVGAPLPFAFDVAPLDTVAIGEAILPDPDVLREEMFARHPGLAAGRAALARSEARIDNERALRTPQPTIVAGVDRQPETNQFLVGLALPLPVFNQRRGQIGEAVAAREEARANLDARRLELSGAFDVAYQRWRIAGQQIAALEGGLLAQAESALTVAEAAFRFGERGFIEVLDAQRVLRQVRSDLLAARFERQFALVEIERLRARDLGAR